MKSPRINQLLEKTFCRRPPFVRRTAAALKQLALMVDCIPFSDTRVAAGPCGADHESKKFSAIPPTSVYVACAVLAVDPTSCQCVHVCGCPVTQVATGINHALHRQINNGATLPGLLKGCAEQNALGATAAMGLPYHCIRELVVVGKRLGCNAHHPLLPCNQCLRYAEKVQSSIQATKRLSQQRLGITVATIHSQIPFSTNHDEFWNDILQQGQQQAFAPDPATSGGVQIIQMVL